MNLTKLHIAHLIFIIGLGLSNCNAQNSELLLLEKEDIIARLGVLNYSSAVRVDTNRLKVIFNNMNDLQFINLGYSLDTCLTYWTFQDSSLLIEGFLADGNTRVFSSVESWDRTKILDTCYAWYPTGFLRYKIYPAEGIHNVDLGSWYSEGGVEIKRLTVIGSGSAVVRKSWYVSGLLKTYEELDKDGLVDGLTIRWHSNGMLQKSTLVNQGKQIYQVFYPNGSRHHLGTILDNSLSWIGERVEYWENGTIRLHGFYSDSIPNKKIGTWREFNPEGKLIKSEHLE